MLIIVSYYIQVGIYVISYSIFLLLIPGSFNSSFRGILGENSSVVLDPILDILLSSLLMTPVWSIVAVSEEITWSGYLFSLLNHLFGEILSYIISGLIWGIFHYPFIFGTSSQYVISYKITPLWYPIPICDLLLNPHLFGILVSFLH